VQRIFVDAPNRVYLERNGRVVAEEVQWSASEVNSAIRALAGPMGAGAAKSGFSVVKDGVRVSGYPINGDAQQVALVFECGPRPNVDLGELVRTDVATKSAAAFLSLALRARLNIGVVGRPGLMRDRWVSALLDAMPFGARVGRIGSLEPAPDRPDVIRFGSASMAGKRRVDEVFTAAKEMRLDRLAVGAVGGNRIALIRQLAAREVPIVTVLTGDTPDDALLRYSALARAEDALGPEVDALVAASFDLLVGVGRGATGRLDWIDALRTENGQPVSERIFVRTELDGPLEELDGAGALWMRWESWVMEPVSRVSRNIVSVTTPPIETVGRPSDPGVGRGTVEIRPPAENGPIAGTGTGGAIDDRPTRIDIIADPPPKGRARSYSDILRSVEGDEDDAEAEPNQANTRDKRASKPLPRLRAPKTRDS